jgi:CBS domain-containing protein
MRIEAILRSNGSRIIAIPMATSAVAAARLLKSENIGAVVVKDTCGTEGDVVLGILSERDLLHALADHGAAALKMPVSSLMSRAVVACGPGDDAEDVAGLMLKHHVRHVPVLEGEALIGVISIRDLLALHAGPASSGAVMASASGMSRTELRQ